MTIHNNVSVAMASGATGKLHSAPVTSRGGDPLYQAAFAASGEREYFAWFARQVSAFARSMGEPSDTVMDRYGHRIPGWLSSRAGA